MPLIELPKELMQYDSVVEANNAGDREALKQALLENYRVLMGFVREMARLTHRYDPRRKAILESFKLLEEQGV